ncbi:MAG: thiamine-phosphate kinase [Rhodospirillales bacterium]
MGEFDLIARAFRPLAAGWDGAFNLLDDAALMPPLPTGQHRVVTSDCLIAGVHFFADQAPEETAAKALAVNLSDLAAMGARPVGYTLALALPRDMTAPEDWVMAFAAELGRCQARHGLTLLGGDTVMTPGPLCLTITAFGDVPADRALRRGGAEAGDCIYVSGTIGDAALGLLVRQGRIGGSDPFLLDRLDRPSPRLALGQALLGQARSCADISDGLVADLGHIAAASGLSARIDTPKLPLSAPARNRVDADPNLLTVILTGGDDYELVFTGPHGLEAADWPTPITAIGRMESGSGVRVIDGQGRALTLKAAGYSHL